jgi:ribA/ribD-fused uncharacterized protein
MENNSANYISFFGKDNMNGWLSNFDTYAQFIDMEGNKFTSTEQYFMSRKAKQWPSANNNIIFKAILNSKNPKESKTLGRSVENFNEIEWANVRFDIMKAGLRYKFSEQNSKTSEYRAKLLATNNSILIEASPFDKIWGIGMKIESFNKLDKNNQNKILQERNLLGRALMAIRAEIKTNINI